ncbi:MAG: hypothetical protein FJ138_03295 [Deltaproteobacteria bacterium]|nr:hypothetical protein [Deltaproteobacteria bacterium]
MRAPHPALPPSRDRRPVTTSGAPRRALSRLLCALLVAAPGAARADRFEALLKDPKLERARLVSERDLERHDLPATQRSRLHFALRGDVLPYYNNEATYFLGLGAPLLSYGPLRWRSLTMWFNTDFGVQFETAASFVVLSSAGGALGDSEVSLGAHGGAQILNNYVVDLGNSFGGVFVDKGFYYGLNARYSLRRLWLELSFDLAAVSRHSSEGGYYSSSSSTEMTRLGVVLGVAL